MVTTPVTGATGRSPPLLLKRNSIKRFAEYLGFEEEQYNNAWARKTYNGTIPFTLRCS